MTLLLERIRSTPDARRISICYKPDNFTARRFYASLGFAETGIDALGEMVAEILLPPFTHPAVPPPSDCRAG